MKAGFAKIDITPDVSSREYYGLGYWYQRAVRFTGVRDPLFVRATAIQDQDRLIFIVSVDAIFDSYGFSKAAVEAISRQHNVGPEAIFICCTHSHSTPLIGLNGIEDDTADYGRLVTQAIVNAAQQAHQNLKTCTIRLIQQTAPQVVRNRRPIKKDGTVATLHEAVDSTEIADWGAVNDTITLIVFEDSSGHRFGGWCHFGIHGVCVQCSDLISSDAMGRAVQAIEKTSPDITILHLNGPCGDIDPIAMDGDPALKETEKRLTKSLLSSMEKTGCDLKLKIGNSRRGTFSARRRTIDPAKILDNSENRESDTQSHSLHHSGQGYEQFLRREMAWLTDQPQTVDIAWQIVNLGPIRLMGVGAELFTRSGEQLTRLFPDQIILPVGITHGWAGYLPPKEAFDQGGYETSAAGWSRIEPGQTEIFLEYLLKQITASGNH